MMTSFLYSCFLLIDIVVFLAGSVSGFFHEQATTVSSAVSPTRCGLLLDAAGAMLSTALREPH